MGINKEEWVGLCLLYLKFSLQNFSKFLPIILLIITYYSHKILLTILHAGNSGVKGLFY